jgi:hypothetical protein
MIASRWRSIRQRIAAMNQFCAARYIRRNDDIDLTGLLIRLCRYYRASMHCHEWFAIAA